MSTKQKVSDRTFIDVNGNEVDSMEQATGARYTLVQAGKSFDVQLGQAGAMPTMFAIFGFWTKIGNVANTTLNDKDDPGTHEDAASDIQEFLDGVTAGTWREAGTGAARGPKYDNAILAHVLFEQVTANAANGGKAAAGDLAHYAGRIEADKGYRAKVLANPAIKTGYFAELAKRGSTVPAPSVDGLV
jgi:hypothetical protein